MQTSLRVIQKRILKRAMATVKVFNYGSNSAAQLRGRVGNPSLQTERAVLKDFTRVFCLESKGWDGGVASIAPHKGSVVHGSVAELSKEEKSMLDVYEHAYRQEEVTIHVERQGYSESVQATVYVAGATTSSCATRIPAPFTVPFAVHPSEQYLTAIHVMLREHWSHLEAEPVAPHHAVAIRGMHEAEADTVCDFGEWKHPGVHKLSLPALCVEINARRTQKWTMPKHIKHFTAQLGSIGVHSVSDLCAALAPSTAGDVPPLSLNAALAAAGQEPLDRETMHILRCLPLHQVFVYGTLLHGESNHHFMKEATRIADSATTTANDITMVYNSEMKYPYAIHGDRNTRLTSVRTRVKGELYVVSDRHLQGPYDDDFPAADGADPSTTLPRGTVEHVCTGPTAEAPVAVVDPHQQHLPVLRRRKMMIPIRTSIAHVVRVHRWRTTPISTGGLWWFGVAPSDRPSAADAAVERVVDDLEGHPGYFRREHVRVVVGADATPTTAWMYFLADAAQHERINVEAHSGTVGTSPALQPTFVDVTPSGDFRTFMATQANTA
eukprot:m.1227844 g.1227844  ORF g.1227844 m.1227844 type:complete len:552 (-) comp24643_c1_seq25:2924-4579(-)